MKTIARIVGRLIALIIVAALVAPMFINEETLKTQLVTQVKKATGRTLEIKGKTSITFLPNIAVSVEDVTLSNPPGFTTPYFVSLKKLSTGAKLRPLLQGELIVDGITLDGATINLEELKSGAKNWEFTQEKLKETADKAVEAPEAQKSSESPLKRFAIGDIGINNTTVNLLKPGANQVKLKDIDLTLSGADANSPLSLDAAATYREERVQFSLDLAKTKPFFTGGVSPLVASVKLPGTSADFSGDVSMNKTISAKGKLSANTASLPKLLEWMTGKKPTGKLPEQITLSANPHYDGEALDLRELSFKLDSIAATGALNVKLGSAVPIIGGSLAFTTIDVDALTGGGSSASPAAGGSASATATGVATSSDWSSAPINLAGLKAVNADLALTWESLKAGKFAIGPTSSHATLRDGSLNYAIKQMQLYKGTASGTVRASSSGIGADLAIAQVDIDALMTALSGTSRLAGKSTVKLNVAASGNSQRAWVNSLNGTGSLAVRDGAVKGINIGEFLRNAKQGFLSDSGSAATDFSELNATFTIANGIVSNSDLAMKSPALRVAGSGTVSVPPKTVNYRLVPTIAGTSKGQGGKDDVGGISIPLVIAGPWSKPSITPDLAGAIQEGLKDPEALKQNIKNLGEGIKDFNSPKDLQRALLGGNKEATPAAAPATADGTVTSTETVPAAAPTKKQQREELIQQGIGGLLKGL